MEVNNLSNPKPHGDSFGDSKWGTIPNVLQPGNPWKNPLGFNGIQISINHPAVYPVFYTLKKNAPRLQT